MSSFQLGKRHKATEQGKKETVWGKSDIFNEEVDETFVVKNYHKLKCYYCNAIITVNSMNGHIYACFNGKLDQSRKAQVRSSTKHRNKAESKFNMFTMFTMFVYHVYIIFSSCVYNVCQTCLHYRLFSCVYNIQNLLSLFSMCFFNLSL